MTVVVWRDGVMAADSGVFRSDQVVALTRKIHRFENGALVGCSGNLSKVSTFIDWYAAGADPESRRMTGDPGFEALVVTPDGRVRVYLSANEVEDRMEAPYFAIGSGAEVAFGALAHGASAIEAVEAAIKHHVFCVGPVAHEFLTPPPARARRAGLRVVSHPFAEDRQ